MEQFQNKFIVVTFIDNQIPPQHFVEPIPWNWCNNGIVYWPVKSKDLRRKGYLDTKPNYDDPNEWERCILKSIKGYYFVSNQFYQIFIKYFSFYRHFRHICRCCIIS